MAIAIVTLSLQSGEAAVRTRSRVRRSLGDRGFSAGTRRGGTGSYEKEGRAVSELLNALREMLEILATTDASEIDHLWVYLGALLPSEQRQPRG
jgi:hypothetical protein